MPKKLAKLKKDDALTSTLFAVNLPKSSKVFDVLGTIDELSSILGLAARTGVKKVSGDIFWMQNGLFSLGSFIAGSKNIKASMLEQLAAELESKIAIYRKCNKPLRSFILPGGSHESAFLHLARAVCRRLERCFVSFFEKKTQITKKDKAIIRHYIDRLSDLLFEMARYCNLRKKVSEKVWKAPK